MHDLSLVMIKASAPYVLTPEEEGRVLQSLCVNGVAAVIGFMPREDVAKLRATTEKVTAPDYVFGGAMRLKAPPTIDASTAEFSHPFLVSDEAAKVVTNPSLQTVVREFLGDEGIIHSAILQVSFPRGAPAVDWHVDCGSNKPLNGRRLTRDKRLRTILYLTDVESGGLGFICGTATTAADVFLAQPEGALYPVDKVPPEPDKRIEVDAPAGTLIFFDTHSLHRPEAPKQMRSVMNIWFARRDFSARLPATLFSLSRIPPGQRGNIGIFDSERGHDPLIVKPSVPPRKGLVRRLMDAFAG